MANFGNERGEQEPLVLMVPGLNNSGPSHWQTLWERERRDCQRVDLGMWDQPPRCGSSPNGSIPAVRSRTELPPL